MIVMNDFKKEYALLEKEIDSAIKTCLQSGWYILGETVDAFEKEFAAYVGTNYAIGVANGMEAIQIALMALGIGEGDEVITVSNSAVATALAVSNVGATPVFVDIDTYNLMDVSKVAEKITSKTKAILPVHLFGQMADMEALAAIAKKHNLYIIEDACQAHGAEIKNKKSGTWGIFGTFSFYPTKNLGAIGDGGAITTNSKELYELCKMLRNYGQTTRYTHRIKGLNSRLDELQAAILRVKLRHLPEAINNRNKIASAYKQHLKDVKEIVLPETRKDSFHAYHLFVIETEKRDELLKYLQENGIQALIHYPIPIHKQECYLEQNNDFLPQTDKASQTVLSLPIHPFMSHEDVETVCKAIKEFFNTAA